MFSCCLSLSSLPDISKWNTKNVGNMSKMFIQCLSLNSLPNIGKWNTNNCYLMIQMFTGCISLTSLANISNLITPFTRTYSMLTNCFSLIEKQDNEVMYI